MKRARGLEVIYETGVQRRKPNVSQTDPCTCEFKENSECLHRWVWITEESNLERYLQFMRSHTIRLVKISFYCDVAAMNRIFNQLPTSVQYLEFDFVPDRIRGLVLSKENHPLVELKLADTFQCHKTGMFTKLKFRNVFD